MPSYSRIACWRFSTKQVGLNKNPCAHLCLNLPSAGNDGHLVFAHMCLLMQLVRLKKKKTTNEQPQPLPVRSHKIPSGCISHLCAYLPVVDALLWLSGCMQTSQCVCASVAVMQSVSDRWMCGAHMKNDSEKARWASQMPGLESKRRC